MTEEELYWIAEEYTSTDWYEDNWYKSKNRGDKERAKETNNRVYKLLDEPHISWWDNSNHDRHYKNDRYCWKTKRKTQYLIKKEKKNKKRKPAHKEHWRYKNPVHSYSYVYAVERVDRKNARANYLEHRRIEEEHFDELKKIGHYRYPDGGFVDNKNYYWDYETKSYKVNKIYWWY